MGLQAAPPDNWPNLIAPDGSLQGVHPDDVPSALAQGYQQATPEQVQQHYQEQRYGSPIEQAKTIGEGLVGGVLSRPLTTKIEESFGANPEDIKGRMETNPGEAGVSEAAGLVGSGLTGVGEGALLSHAGESLAAHAFPALNDAKAGVQAAKEALASGDEAAHVLTNAKNTLAAIPATSKLGAAALQGAAENVLYGAGNSVNESMLGDHDALGEALLPTIGFNALIGGVGGAGLSALGMGTGKLADIADKLDMSPSNAFKKVTGQALGVDPEVVGEYLKNREAVNSVSDFDELYQHALGHLEGVTNDLSTAKEAYASYEQSMKDQLMQKGYDAKLASQTAKAALNQAQEKLAGDTLNQALDAAPSVSNSVSALRQHVMAGSEAAYNTLEQSGQTVNLKPMYDKANELINDLEQQGTIESKNHAEAIRRQMQSMAELHPTGVAPAPAVKPLIKGLDNISGWSTGNTSEQNVLGKQFRQIRHTLDDTLKTQVPAYGEAMKPVAGDASLLKSLDNYAEPQSAARRIKSMTNPVNYKYEMPQLRQLEARVGTPFTGDIEKYANPDIRKAMEDALPEAKTAREAAELTSDLQNPATKQAWAAKLHDSPEYSALMKAQEAAEKFKGVSPAGLQGKLNKAISGSSIDARKLISQFPDLEGKTIPEILDALRIRQAFEKGAMNGSRNVNAAGTIGAFIGSLAHGVSPLFGYAGAAAGAAAGHVIDKNGPAMAKKLVDAYIDNQSKLSGLAAINRSATALAKKITTGAGRIFSNSGPAIASVAAKWDYDKVKKTLGDYNGSFNDAAQGTHARTRDIQKVAPNTAGSLQAKTAGAASFLQSKLPTTPTATPFQPNFTASAADQSKFKKYYETVSNPLSVLDSVRNGTVTPSQIETLQTVYPKMYAQMQQSVYSEMMDHVQKGKPVPYQTRVGVSLFMGQPLDSTMTPASIIAAQPKPATPPQQQPQQGKLTKSAGDKLGKLSQSYQTKSQAAESDRSSRD